jgi:hypothetical protein
MTIDAQDVADAVTKLAALDVALQGESMSYFARAHIHTRLAIKISSAQRTNNEAFFYRSLGRLTKLIEYVDPPKEEP